MLETFSDDWRLYGADRPGFFHWYCEAGSRASRGERDHSWVPFLQHASKKRWRYCCL